ncbi:hypothetical protein [Kytococcus sp. Marseille-QA3725]
MREDHPDLTRLDASPPSPVADAVSAVLDPQWVLPLVLGVVGWRAEGPVGVAWAAVALMFVVVLPLGLVRWLRRRGSVADRRIVRREQRVVPLVGAGVSVTGGLALMHLVGAPADLVRLLASVLVVLLVFGLVTLAHKISFHVGVVAGGAAGLLASGAVTVGGLLVPCVPLIAWARVRGGRHTVGQVLLGSVLAPAVTVACWRALGG